MALSLDETCSYVIKQYGLFYQLKVVLD